MYYFAYPFRVVDLCLEMHCASAECGWVVVVDRWGSVFAEALDCANDVICFLVLVLAKDLVEA